MLIQACSTHNATLQLFHNTTHKHLSSWVAYIDHHRKVKRRGIVFVASYVEVNPIVVY